MSGINKEINTMINYSIIHCICRPFPYTFYIPILEHYLCVVCLDGVYVLWRGEKRIIKKCLKMMQNVEKILIINRFNCVWNVLCETNEIIKMVIVKIYNTNLLHDIVYAEMNRVVNF
ncbi:hypothetical protein [Psilogramma increta granulovirus]|uniref:Uncharacterized protein n=1 Tax=Psilogramma increta granulovirus TaxID=2953508 RepID=A0A977XVX6_9BBAC|nr:hypothetical protein [Psilogramma increta granulovirus]